MERHHLEFASAAERDIRRLDRAAKTQINRGLDRLVAIPPANNLNIVPIAGHPPFLQMRIGEFRVLYRPLSQREMAMLVMRRGALDGPTGFLVARVVNRRDLERAVATLQRIELQ